MNIRYYFKYLLLIFFLFQGVTATAEGDRGGRETADRGAGGGGDPLMAIIKAGKSRVLLRGASSQDFLLGDLRYLFCEKATQGLEKIESLDIDQKFTATMKIEEMCENKEKIEIVQNLKLKNGEPVSAMNWPKVPRLAFDDQRMTLILKTFDSDTRDLLLEVLFAHEALSLVFLESTGVYTYSMELIEQSQLPNQPELERAIGDKAMLFEMNQSILDIDKYEREKDYPGILVANNSNFIREQLLNFSPLFDNEVRQTLGNSFYSRFQERTASVGKGSYYFSPINDHLLEPVLQRFKDAFEKRNINVNFSKTERSWALAFQLHQLLLAVDEIDATVQRESLRKLNFIIKVRLISLNIPFYGEKITRDDHNVEIIFNKSLNSKLQALKKLFQFRIEKENPYMHGDLIQFRQTWPMLAIGLNSTYSILWESGNFVYRPDMPSYKESFEYSGGGGRFSLFKRDLGLMTKEHIKDFLRIELRNNQF